MFKDNFPHLELQPFINQADGKEEISGVLEAKETFKGKIYKILSLIEEHSVETRIHIDSVAGMFIIGMAEILANKDLFVKKDFTEHFYEQFRLLTPEELGLSASIHDIGKLLVPKNILHKEGRLSPTDWVRIENHTRTGGKFLREIYNTSSDKNKRKELLRDVMAHLIEFHHKTKGDGYPNELQGKKIPFYAEFLRLCDIYDALRRKRSYKNSFARNEALKIIYGMKNSFEHPDIFDLFIELEPTFDEYILKYDSDRTEEDEGSTF